MSYALQHLISNNKEFLYFEFLPEGRVTILFSIAAFWLLIFFLFYTYVGYPIFVSFLGKICNKTVVRKSIQPSITLIIAAHNEQDCIRAKIENTLEINYPKDKLEIIVASDCSIDNTNAIVKEFRNSGVILCEQTERLGKTSAQIAAVRMSHGEILVFSDASTIYNKDSISLIVQNFSEQDVGCVGGRVMFLDDVKRGATARRVKQNVITDIEHTIREGESRIYGTPGVSGCVYAVRKSYYREIDPRIADDFGVPLDILMRGYRVVFEPEAIAYEDIEKHSIDLRRNIRTINQGWVALQLLDFMGLWRKEAKRFSYILFMLLGHKLLRWLSFVFLVLLFVINVMIVINNGSVAYIGLLWSQVVFYVFSACGALKLFSGGFFLIPFRFCLYHCAAFIAFYKFCRSEKIVIWDSAK